MTPDRDQIIEQIADAIVEAYGEDASDNCPCEQDWDVARVVHDSVITALLTTARREGAEQAATELRAWLDEAVMDSTDRAELYELADRWMDENPHKIAKGDDE